MPNPASVIIIVIYTTKESLTKNDYLGKNKDGVVTVLKKGRELFPDEASINFAATQGKSRLRVLQVSKV